jgi:rhamnogalacturonyl hydrolase YesR
MNSKKISFLFLITCGFFSSYASINYKKSILEIAHKVADYQLDHPYDTTMLDWIQGPFINGMMAIGRLPGGEKYIKAVHNIGLQEKWGVINSRWRANDLCTSQSWIEMFEIKKKPVMFATVRKELDQIMDSISKQDDRLECNEKNCMKWSWCDALYMAPPTFARMGKVTGEQKYYDFLHRWWWKVSAYYYEPEEHLYYRDQNYFTRHEPNGARIFWSRGNGWVMGGLVRVLQYLPAHDPYRPKYEQQLREMCLKLKAIQGQDGLWHSGLLDPEAHKQDETSGSAFFVYGMAYAINEGIVEKEAFNEPVMKAWNSLCNYVKPDGRFTGIQPIGDAPVVYDENFSMPYGVGAFLQAASEIYRLQ